jgi:hypothetical protein
MSELARVSLEPASVWHNGTLAIVTLEYINTVINKCFKTCLLINLKKYCEVSHEYKQIFILLIGCFGGVLECFVVERKEV